MRRSAAVLSAVLCLAVTPPAAQERSAAEPVLFVRGQVRSDDDAAMLLRRTRVSVPGGPDEPVFADSDGRFEIAVRPRSTTLRFAKPGFAPRRIPIPAASPSAYLDVRLARGAAITGRVVDELGSPVVSADVRVRSVPDASDRDAVPVTTTVRTDDLGEFRIGSLPAGVYEAAAVARGLWQTVTIGRPDTTITVRLRAAEETGLELFYPAGARDVRAASDYAAGYGDAQRSQLASDPALARSARGTAVVTGRVVAPDGRGIAGAIVRLNPASAGLARVAASNAAGDFQFRGIAAGRYRVVATKVGFLAGEYGQGRPGQPARVIAVRDGQLSTKADIGLQRGGVIVGVVMDADGEPIEGIAVHVWRIEFRTGGPVAEPVTDVDVRRTDDRGRYRLHGLQPGSYYVVASEDPASPATASRSVRGVPRAYYPGVGLLADASTVTIGAGLAPVGADFVFAPAPARRVRGQARDASDEPLPRVTLVHRNPAGAALPSQTVDLVGDSFEFSHVVPGDYVVQGTRSGQFGKLSFRVEDADVTLPLLRTAPGSTLNGRVVFEGGPTFRPPLRWLDVVHVDPEYAPATNERLMTVTVRDPMAIEVSGLMGSIRFAGSDGMPDGWYLKAVDIDGRNAVEQPVVFRGGAQSRSDVRIVVSNAAAGVSGRALDGRQEPAGSYVAVAFPVDTRRWIPGGRHVRTAAPDEQGEFRLTTLPPGEYWLAAIESIDERLLQDPAVLDALREIGTRVDLSPGERMTTDLQLARLQ